MGISVSEEQLKERFQKDSTDFSFEILRIARELNLKARAGRLNVKKFADVNVPVIAALNNGGYILLLNRKGDKRVILNPLNGTPETVDEAELAKTLTGDVVILGKRAEEMKSREGKIRLRLVHSYDPEI